MCVFKLFCSCFSLFRLLLNIFIDVLSFSVEWVVNFFIVLVLSMIILVGCIFVILLSMIFFFELKEESSFLVMRIDVVFVILFIVWIIGNILFLLWM